MRTWFTNRFKEQIEEISRLKGVIKYLKELINERDERINKLEYKLVDICKRNDIFVQHLEAKDREIENLRGGMEDLRNLIGGLDGCVSDAERRNEKLQEENEKLQREMRCTKEFNRILNECICEKINENRILSKTSPNLDIIIVNEYLRNELHEKNKLIKHIIQQKDEKIRELCRKIVDLWKENKELKESTTTVKETTTRSWYYYPPARFGDNDAT